MADFTGDMAGPDPSLDVPDEIVVPDDNSAVVVEPGDLVLQPWQPPPDDEWNSLRGLFVVGYEEPDSGEQRYKIEYRGNTGCVAATSKEPYRWNKRVHAENFCNAIRRGSWPKASQTLPDPGDGEWDGDVIPEGSLGNGGAGWIYEVFDKTQIQLQQMDLDTCELDN